MGEEIRSFIAIELPDNVRGELVHLEEHLAATGADVKWVEPENMHLTLKFLGNIKTTDIDNVKEALSNTCSRSEAFVMRLNQIGAFPNLNFPRVIWAGIDKGKDDIMGIFSALEEKLAGAGFQKDARPLSPHLTIGRVRTPVNKDVLRNKMEGIKFVSKYDINVEGVSLFKSVLTQKGPIHELIFKADLLH